ncbi:nucleoside-diphosphate-sugar epimerase [Thioflavicoccus mobilis 8321]|uniref:Nucleoside-diphosphate-sugar epimerase n=1 Tax=Thioflavicoccus mobilis 8321 TaxID=765912 RepID=L0GXQ1_9GAMM|nr:SDR family oxidoreductase [Thioflavicoccus mobilis]AGA90155.1 nucleoside-diphosphate-sugar epimerase [Thioflavicoccus mobilis 8321]
MTSERESIERGEPALLILGCGYLGRRLARHYMDLGVTVLGVVASESSRRTLLDEGIPAIAVDLASADLAVLPLTGRAVFHLAPPPGQGVEDWVTRRLAAAFARQGHPRRLVYISTSGVYGDCGGAWVDETWPVRPSADRARRRWDAEQALRQWRRASGAALVVLRVAGIYGPGRLPLERIRQGLPLVRESQAPFSNRIHVDDLAQACVAAMERGSDGEIYNVCDDYPSTMTDYFFQIADAAGLPRPPVIPISEMEGQLSPGMRSYMRESRRLSNRKLRDELGVTLTYPALKDGLPGALGRR